jgi:ABC-type antimicrobial peptide transport system permease subunit
MNAKNFLVSGIVGGIVNFLLGWLFYGILFESQFPVKEGEVMNLTMIALACLVGGLFIAYIFTKWAHISNWKTGLQAGAVIGLFLALYYDFYYNAMKANADIDWQNMGLDIVLTIVMTALTGAVIAIIIDKMK